MDDVFTALIPLILIFSFSATAAEVEYISPEKQQQLETLFSEARFSPLKDAPRLTANEWTCDMYGMRTHLQVQRELKLYKWSDDGKAWHNGGAQLVSDYKSESAMLIGRKDRFEDQVKITQDGQLVSRLILNSTTATQTIIAYSVCKTL